MTDTKIDLRTNENPYRSNISKIIQLGMEDDVLKQLASGKTLEQISNHIKNITGEYVSKTSIKKFIDKSKKATKDIMKTNSELAKKHATVNLNYKKLLYDMMQDNWEVQRKTLES